MRKAKLYLLCALAAFQLSCVVAGSWGTNIFNGTFLAPFFEAYGRLSGTLAQIKFFSPGLISQIRVIVDGKTLEGKEYQTTFLTGNREVDLRIYNILAAYWAPSISKDKKLQRSIVASWAGKIFGEQPNLESVRIRVEAVELPSMEIARLGGKLFWHEIYRAEYLKKQRHLELLNEKT